MIFRKGALAPMEPVRVAEARALPPNPAEQRGQHWTPIRVKVERRLTPVPMSRLPRRRTLGPPGMIPCGFFHHNAVRTFREPDHALAGGVHQQWEQRRAI